MSVAGAAVGGGTGGVVGDCRSGSGGCNMVEEVIHVGQAHAVLVTQTKVTGFCNTLSVDIVGFCLTISSESMLRLEGILNSQHKIIVRFEFYFVNFR